ncbi:hypothetical protein G6F56_005536 [Rhizopus delemar]|nr:hypothetical protein G6F56_005536 [Rhizopus delemar]
MTSHRSLFLSSKVSRADKRTPYPPSPPLSNSGYRLWSPNTVEQEQMSSTYSLSVEKAIQVYGSQPALLGLILSSKVEEDRRMAEEAKLRRKEIDYALERQKKEKAKQTLPLPILPHLPQREEPAPMVEFSPRSTLPPLNMNSSSLKKRDIRKNSIDMLLIPTEKKDSQSKLLEIPATPKKDEESSNKQDRSNVCEVPNPFPPSPPNEPTQLSRKRKREIQAITTIIETKEFPYSDDYLWKNNGNTVHKKSGLKSIYYKCSNGTKGCPVNKTVTFKENGEYLIKYRGEHLTECNRIKRITHL